MPSTTIPDRLQIRTLSQYQRRLTKLTEKYERIVEPDGGFGLTPSQRSSIVNTSEVLHILRSANRRDVPVSLTLVDEAVDYVASNVSRHCAPRTSSGGRGEKTRFAIFALVGLSAWPDRLQKSAHEQAVNWTIDWLRRRLLEDGLPEEAGVQDVSLFQNALAQVALARLSAVPGIDRETRNGVAEIARVCATGSAYHMLPACTWPRHTYLTATSPAKTALTITGLASALEAGLLPDSMVFGGALQEGASFEVSDILQRSCDALTQGVSQWHLYIEPDPDVPGTQWSHLSYAVCLEAISVVGNPRDSQLVDAWRGLFRTWSRTSDGWCEPTEPPIPSARADYSSTRALDALIDHHGVSGLRDVAALAALDSVPSATPRYELVCQSGSGALTLTRLDQPRQTWALDLPHRLREFVVLMASQSTPEGRPLFITTSELAAVAGLSSASIGRTVKRVNEAVQLQSVDGYQAIMSRRGQGYRLNLEGVTWT